MSKLFGDMVLMDGRLALWKMCTIHSDGGTVMEFKHCDL